jgi:hypothetical protein
MCAAGSSHHADDWYRSANWDEAARAEFDTRLARARADNRIQYRRIKALALLESGDPVREAAGAALLQANLASPDLFDFERVVAFRRLAEMERAAGRLDEAERRMRQALSVGGPDGNGTSGEEETALAEMLLERGGRERIAEARALLDRRSEDVPLFARSRFRLCVAQVRVSIALGNQDLAQEWAVAALRVAGEEHSGLTHHPNLGLVESDPSTIHWLEAVASRNP